MTYRWSPSSLEKLATVHDSLVAVCNRALDLQLLDFKIIEGVRTAERQKMLFDQEMSKLDGVNRLSNHQLRPGETLARAVDIAPIVNGEIPWNDREIWIYCGGIWKACAASLNIPIRWGGDWNGDHRFVEKFFDGPHLELPRR